MRKRPRTTILILFIACASSWIATVRLYVNQRDLEFRLNEVELDRRPSPVIYDCEHAQLVPPRTDDGIHFHPSTSIDYQ